MAIGGGCRAGARLVGGCGWFGSRGMAADRAGRERGGVYPFVGRVRWLEREETLWLCLRWDDCLCREVDRWIAEDIGRNEFRLG